MDKIEKQRLHFDHISERYYTSRQSRSHLLFKDLMWGFFFRDKSFLKKEGMHVLEPMCGYAEGKDILEKHLEARFEYEGFDYSEVLVSITRKKNPSLNVTVADVTRFRPHREYDLVILIGALHHVHARADTVLGSIYGWLKQGGHLINFEATHNTAITARIREEIYRRNSLFDRETEQDFALRELNDLYRANNFTIIDQIYPGLLCYALHYNPDAFPLLDIGSGGITRFLFHVDKLFFRNGVGRKLSFATLTLLQK